MSAAITPPAQAPLPWTAERLRFAYEMRRDGHSDISIAVAIGIDERRVRLIFAAQTTGLPKTAEAIDQPSGTY